MTAAPCLPEAERGEGGVVFRQFDAGLELKARQAKRLRAGFGERKEPTGQAAAAGGIGDGQFADVEVIGFRREDDAGQRAGDDPEFVCPGLLRQEGGSTRPSI